MSIQTKSNTYLWIFSLLYFIFSRLTLCLGVCRIVSVWVCNIIIVIIIITRMATAHNILVCLFFSILICRYWIPGYDTQKPMPNPISRLPQITSPAQMDLLVMCSFSLSFSLLGSPAQHTTNLIFGQRKKAKKKGIRT